MTKESAVAVDREVVKDSLPTLEEMMKGDNAPIVAPSQEINEISPDIKEENIQDEKKIDKQPQKEGNIQEEIDYEKNARMDGWAPKDEYKGDPKLWVDAKEWIARAPLLHKISSQSKEMKNMTKTNAAMVKMLQNLTDRLDKEQATEILNKKRVAIEQGDIEAVEKYEKRYNEITKKSEDIPESSSAPPEVEDFIQRNKEWFNDKPESLALTAYAKQIEADLMHTRPELTLEQRLMATENIVKEDSRYQTKFSNQNRDRPQMVESKTAPQPRVRDKITFADLPPDVKNVLRLQKQAEPRLDLDTMAQKLLDTGAVRYE
jgi:hypothetical protein